MRRSTLALVLALVLLVLSLASCGGDKAASTTAAKTVGSTECAHVWGEFVYDVEPSCTEPGEKSRYCTVCGAQDPASVSEVEMLAHTEAEDYRVDTPATCNTKGSESKHCTVCGQIIASTVRAIPINEEAHVVANWSDTPTLLNPSVHATGECTVCKKPLEADLTFTPAVFDSKHPSGQYYTGGTFIVSKNAEDIRGDKHFCPDESNGMAGNDLWFEYSFLWNESFANWSGLAEMEVAGLWNADGQYAHHRPFFYCYMRNDVKDYCRYAGHFDYTTNMPDLGAGVFLDTENGQSYLAGYDAVVTENSHPSLGEYGWHRLGVHYHQEVVGYDEEKGGTVYAGYHELFIDGVKVWKILSNVQGHWNGTGWYTKDKDMKGSKCMLWTAEYDGVNWSYTENNVSVKLYMNTSLRSAAASVYVVVDDPIWTCGNGFALNVEPNPTPTETTITLADGVVVPGTIHFKLAD